MRRGCVCTRAGGAPCRNAVPPTHGAAASPLPWPPARPRASHLLQPHGRECPVSACPASGTGVSSVMSVLSACPMDVSVLCQLVQPHGCECPVSACPMDMSVLCHECPVSACRMDVSVPCHACPVSACPAAARGPGDVHAGPPPAPALVGLIPSGDGPAGTDSGFPEEKEFRPRRQLTAARVPGRPSDFTSSPHSRVSQLRTMRLFMCAHTGLASLESPGRPAQPRLPDPGATPGCLPSAPRPAPPRRHDAALQPLLGPSAGHPRGADGPLTRTPEGLGEGSVSPASPGSSVAPRGAAPANPVHLGPSGRPCPRRPTSRLLPLSLPRPGRVSAHSLPSGMLGCAGHMETQCSLPPLKFQMQRAPQISIQ